MMALAAFVEEGNKTLCQYVGSELLSSQEVVESARKQRIPVTSARKRHKQERI